MKICNTNVKTYVRAQIDRASAFKVILLLSCSWLLQSLCVFLGQGCDFENVTRSVLALFDVDNDGVINCLMLTMMVF